MHRADAVQTRPGGNRRDINAINIYWHPCNCGFMARPTLLLCTLRAVHFKRWENETTAAAGLWLGLIYNHISYLNNYISSIKPLYLECTSIGEAMHASRLQPANLLEARCKCLSCLSSRDPWLALQCGQVGLIARCILALSRDALKCTAHVLFCTFDVYNSV